MSQIVKPGFKSLLSRDKSTIQNVTRWPVIGFRYKFFVDHVGVIWFTSPGTTSQGSFREYRRGDREDMERYISRLAMFAVINLIKKGNLAMLDRNIEIAAYQQAPKGAALNIWESIEANCGYTLEDLKELYNKGGR